MEDELRLSDELQKYLAPSNPFLLELQSAYSQLNIGACHHIHWTAEFVRKEIDLHRFRADSGFMWLHRDANVPLAYIATYLYLKASGHSDLLRSCPDDGLFGAYTVRFEDEILSRDRLDSVVQIGYLRSRLGISPKTCLRVLDIGSGYGRLAHRLGQSFPTCQVLCADAVPEASFLCDFYLHYRQISSAQMVRLDEIEDRATEEPIDLVVAINSLSECSHIAAHWWTTLVGRTSARYFLFVSHLDARGQPVLESEDCDLRNRTHLPALLDKVGFHLIDVSPKYREPLMQEYGISPTYFHLFERN